MRHDNMSTKEIIDDLLARQILPSREQIANLWFGLPPLTFRRP